MWSLAKDQTMGVRWETVEENTPVAQGSIGIHHRASPPRLRRTPTANGSGTFDCGRRQPPCRKIDRAGWLLRQPKGESRTAAEVVMDEALMQDDGIGLIFAELDRCWEVTQDQDKASKIEKALLRDPEGPHDGDHLHVLRHAEKAQHSTDGQCVGDPSWQRLSRGTRPCETRNLRTAATTRLVMWTGGSYDYDDVMRALVRLDRPEMQPGASG